MREKQGTHTVHGMVVFQPATGTQCIPEPTDLSWWESHIVISHSLTSTHIHPHTHTHACTHMHAHLLKATLSCRSSGDTYSAVPTNELALSTEEEATNTPYLTHTTFTKCFVCLPSSVRSLAVPKSVILMCPSLSRRMFSGLRSLYTHTTTTTTTNNT